MNRQILLGVVGEAPDSPFYRSWIHELIGDPFLSDVLIIVKIDKSDITNVGSKLPFDGILYQLNGAEHAEYEEYLGAMMAKGVPVIVDVSKNVDHDNSLTRFLTHARLVTTSCPSVARGVARFCSRVIVWGETVSGRGVTDQIENRGELGIPGHWLWIVDDALSLKAQLKMLATLGEETHEGTKGKVTIVGPPPDLAVPRWVTTVSIPASISRLGSGAASAWITNFNVNWDRVLWEAGDAWHLSRIYRDLALRRFVRNDAGTLSESGWPESDVDSDEQRIHQMQVTAILSVFPEFDILHKGSSLIMFDYDQSDAHDRQRMAFPSEAYFVPDDSIEHRPLVSILIPAYNRPDYLIHALESALFQTYDNIEIIIGDDSTTDDVEKLIRSKYLSKYDNIRYWRNKINRGQFQNDLDLIAAASGEYLNILMDDDLLHLDKIRSQMEYFLGAEGDKVGMVTSHRAVVDADGRFKSIFASTKDLFNSTERIPGREAIEKSLRANRNFFGEPTTVLFRKSMLGEDFGSLFGRKYVCNVDHASWLQILQHGDAVFMNDALSAYRFHDGQQSWTPRAALGGSVDFAHATLGARGAGYLAGSRDFEEAIRRCLDRLLAEQLKIADISELDDESTVLYDRASTYITELQSMLVRVDNSL